MKEKMKRREFVKTIVAIGVGAASNIPVSSLTDVRLKECIMQIRVWYGLEQRIGHLGKAQNDFNLLGEVICPKGIVDLRYTLNGAPPISLSVGDRSDGFGDGRRLARTGHFNADIPISSLHQGMNKVVLTAVDTQENTVQETVTIQLQTGNYDLPVSIDWNKVENPQDVGQYVDGEWGLQANGLRVLHTGYDRIFLIGEKSWQDYEIIVPVIIHHVDEVTGPVSGSNGVGILMRFTGHVNGGPREFPVGQPKWGYQPFGAIGWLRWMQGKDEPPQKQFYSGDSNDTADHGVFPVKTGTIYWMKTRCETLPDDVNGHGVTRYSFKIWLDTRAEPDGWDWQETQTSEYALRRGGVVLLSHHVDSTFGNITISEI